MVSKSCLAHLRSLATGVRNHAALHDGVKAVSLCKSSKRSMASVSDAATMVADSPAAQDDHILSSATTARPQYPEAKVTTTIYSFPKMEPLRFSYYPESHLYLPLRKDILHRAVIYEGDMARQGTASTKWRSEVHGSHKKILPQKGMGMARAGDKQSPIRRGGGVAFGPKPRDFATKLPKKIYDLAWRTALSFRYKNGQLILVDRIEDDESAATWWLDQIFEKNGWGNADGRSLLIAKSRNRNNNKLFQGMEKIGYHGRLIDADDVDVKDLLSMGRLIIEQRALHQIIRTHGSDLIAPIDYSTVNVTPEILKEM